MEPTIGTGPVTALSEIDIPATDRAVWSVLADIEAWPTWNPAIRDAFMEGGLEVSAPFRYATGPGTISCRILEVDAPRRLAWSGRQMGIGHRRIWRIEPSAVGSLVVLEGAMTGPIARIFAVRLRRLLQAEVEAWLHLLKLEVGSRAAGLPAAEEGSSP